MNKNDRDYFAEILELAAFDLRNDASGEVTVTYASKADCHPGRRTLRFDLNLTRPILDKEGKRFWNPPRQGVKGFVGDPRDSA